MALLRFRAGRVSYDEDSKLCTPSPIKGEITISESEEGEGCYSFEWTPKEKTINETIEKDELLIFSGDVTWKKVKSCSSGRVYMLTFLSSGDKNLYWMQSKNDEDEDETADIDYLAKESASDKQVNEKINELFRGIE